ncbi:MAG: hypothetical protein HC810_05215 [Acaryochloridaceae cyanobacterium RL_2_7]|nr:hypothetical protein [Acaryochloridaceae cyanobacterium RL_2_7]
MIPFILGIQGNPCTENIRLSSPTTSVGRITYQWFRNGVAIQGATMANYQIPKGEEGIYVLKANDGGECELSNSFNYKLDTAITKIQTEICKGEVYTVSNQKI